MIGTSWRSLAKSIRNQKGGFDVVIDVLEEGGIITVEKIIPPTGGTPSISYSLAKAVVGLALWSQIGITGGKACCSHQRKVSGNC